MSNRIVTTKPGEVIDFETTFEEGAVFAETPAKTGRVVKVVYTTDVYEDGNTYAKHCWVYLPYCYDEADQDRKYNVLYYQHGNTCEPEIFVENKHMFDQLFSDDSIEPCIIVSTTYYFDLNKDYETRKRTGLVPAGDGGDANTIPNFYKEVIQNIIPAVETRFHTYLTDPSEEGIKATRDHRAFSGYSRGSVFTWKCFHYNFEYFRWFAPMSCHTTADQPIRTEVPMEKVIDFVTEPIKAHPELPFFLYCTAGYPDDAQIMHVQMKEITKDPVFSYGKDPAANNIYYSLSDYKHTDILVPYYYYNSLKVLFKA